MTPQPRNAVNQNYPTSQANNRTSGLGYVPSSGSGRGQQRLTFNLAANATVQVAAEGTFFYLVQVSGQGRLPLLIQPSNGTASLYYLGQGFNINPTQDAEGFSNLQVTNISSQAIQFSIVVGFGIFINSQLLYQFGSNPIVTQPGATINQANAVTSIAGGATLAPVPASPEFQQQSFYISNNDLTQSLRLLDSTGVAFLTVFPSTSIRIDGSAGVSVFNPNAGAVSVLSGSTFIVPSNP